MEFINAEEFLNQPKEIQKVFMEWWQPSIGDLYACTNNGVLKVIDVDVLSEYETEGSLKNTIHCFNSIYDYIIPLLTEGQLRKFIEDKTNSTIDITRTFLKEGNKYNFDFELWIVVENRIKYNGSFEYDMENNLLQAYWKVACEMAKESVENE